MKSAIPNHHNGGTSRISSSRINGSINSAGLGHGAMSGNSSKNRGIKGANGFQVALINDTQTSGQSSIQVITITPQKTWTKCKLEAKLKMHGLWYRLEFIVKDEHVVKLYSKETLQEEQLAASFLSKPKRNKLI